MEKDAKMALFGAVDDDYSKKNSKETYKVITVSLYNKDYDLLNQQLEILKERGYHRVNKSKIIRYALRTLNIDDLPNFD